MARAIWGETALDDLREIIGFIGKDSPAYAAKMGTRIVEAPRRLELDPRAGWMVPEFELDHLRELLVRPYRIIYEVRGEKCHIVAVVHGSRDLTQVIRPG